mgnify:CR=1 FL=1
MNHSKATPRPWALTDGSKRIHPAGHVWGANGRLTAGCMGYSTNTEPDGGTGENAANAALIVRAVNAHDELMAMARRLANGWGTAIEQERARALLAECDAENPV